MSDNIFHNLEYNKLLIGQIMAHFADSIMQIVVIAWVIDNFSFAGKPIVVVSFFFLLPQFILSPFIGDFADKFNRKKILVVSNLYRFILVLLILIFVKFLYFSPQTSFLIISALAFLLGSGYSFFYSAKVPAMTNIVVPSQLKAANFINSGSINFINIFGVAVAGFTIIYIGLNKTLLCAAISYLLAALIFFRINFIYPQKFDFQKKNIFSDTKRTLDYIFKHKVVLQFILLSIVTSLKILLIIL